MHRIPDEGGEAPRRMRSEVEKVLWQLAQLERRSYHLVFSSDVEIFGRGNAEDGQIFLFNKFFSYFLAAFLRRITINFRLFQLHSS